jgi:hypothetical protein
MLPGEPYWFDSASRAVEEPCGAAALEERRRPSRKRLHSRSAIGCRAAGGIFARFNVTSTKRSHADGNIAETAGGGIFARGIGDVVSLSGTVVTKNRATADAAAADPGDGGGIYSTDKLTLINSQVTLNAATASGGHDGAGCL